MKDNVYTIIEAKKISSHFWDTIVEQTLLDYNDNHLFSKIGCEIASHFAKKHLTINNTTFII